MCMFTHILQTMFEHSFAENNLQVTMKKTISNKNGIVDIYTFHNRHVRFFVFFSDKE